MPDTQTFARDERRSPVLLRVLLFVALYALLQWVYMALRGSSLGPWFIHRLTAQPAGALVAAAFPSGGVVEIGSSLVWPGGSMALHAVRVHGVRLLLRAWRSDPIRRDLKLSW